MRVGIIGAGMAGLSCAQALRHQGHDVIVFDKGRGPGGRMSTRRIDTPLGEVAFDHGAQYLTARDRAFVAQVERWAQDGHVARWSPAGSDAWVGTPAMNAPIRAMARDGDVRWNTAIDALTYDGEWRIGNERFDAAIVAVPAEQVAPLVAGHDVALADAACCAVSDPCWTVMAAYDGTVPIDRDRLADLASSDPPSATRPSQLGLDRRPGSFKPVPIGRARISKTIRTRCNARFSRCSRTISVPGRLPSSRPASIAGGMRRSTR